MDPKVMGGVPCLRGLRIPVATVVNMVAGGLTVQDIVDELPPLEADDVAAVMRASAERWAWEASLYPDDTEYQRHQRALALAGRDAALARLAEVTR